MRAFVLIAGSMLAASSMAQISLQEATNKVNGMNGALSCTKEARIWAFTASDEDLIAAIKAGTPDKAIAAAYEAGARPHAEVIEATSAAMEKRDARFGYVAVHAFQQAKTREARMALFSAVDDEHREVRWLAALYSAKLGFRGSRPALLDAVQCDRVDAVQALAMVGQREDAKVVRKFYDRSVKKEYPGWGPYDPNFALLTLGALKDEWAIAKLRKAADNDTDWSFRADAIHTLATLRMPEDETRFRGYLKDSNLEVQAAAVEALGLLQSRAGVSDILAFASSPTSKTGPDAVNSVRWRAYANLVALTIVSGKPPVSRKEWGMQNPPYKFYGQTTAITGGSNR